MMLKKQDGVICSLSLVEGYVGPCHSANEPRALHFVAAAVATLVSIQHYAILTIKNKVIASWMITSSLN
jgi:hypothetical protein